MLDKLSERHPRAANFIQNMLEDWMGNSIMLGLFCAGSIFWRFAA